MLHPTLFAASLLSPDHLVQTFGTVGIAIMIFLESCFAPLPGDSVLFSAGLLASEHKYGLNLWVICILTFIAATTGNQVGYWFGRKAGIALYKRPNSKIFKTENLEKTHAYFEHYGPKTILLARFVPFVRGLAPIVAGVGRMDFKVFTIYNIVGGFIWTFGFTIGGWFLGKSIPNVDRYVLPLVAAVVIITSMPIAFEYWRARKNSKQKPTPSGTVNNTIEEEVRPD